MDDGKQITFDAPIKLRVRDLSVRYGEKVAVDRVSMNVPDRRVTALIGPSGCGKSTFLRCLNRMNDHIRGAVVSGRVEIEGVDLYAPEADPVVLRRRVGMVFQKSNPFPKTIFENVAFGPRVHGVTDTVVLREVVERSLQRAALWDEVHDRLDTSALARPNGPATSRPR
jgi:phosphate transport system ATP-binding protein